MKILLHNLLKKLKKCVYYIDIGPRQDIIDELNDIESKSKEVSDSLNKSVFTLKEVSQNTKDITKDVARKAKFVTDGSADTLNKLENATKNIVEISDSVKKLSLETDTI